MTSLVELVAWTVGGMFLLFVLLELLRQALEVLGLVLQVIWWMLWPVRKAVAWLWDHTPRRIRDPIELVGGFLAGLIIGALLGRIGLRLLPQLRDGGFR